MVSRMLGREAFRAYLFIDQTLDKRELVSEEFWIHTDFVGLHCRSIAVVLLLPVAKFPRLYSSE